MIKLKSLLSEAACGHCFKWAYRKVTKGGPLLRLVHGTVFVPFLGKRINHAWVENKKSVFDWQMNGNGRKNGIAYIKLLTGYDEKHAGNIHARGYDKKSYYKDVKVKVDDVYDKMEAGITMLKNKHLGPWK